MFHVERAHARRVRGSRRNCDKVTGYYSYFIFNKMQSNSDWSKKEFGNKWFLTMVWNRAALHMEGGIPREWARRAYYLRWPAQWVRIKGVHR